jgi:hypothetical protein
MSIWEDLTLELRREAEAVFRSTGEVVVVALGDKPDAMVMVVFPQPVLEDHSSRG